MRPREDELIDPEIAEQLDAIDATLAGDPVPPRFAELAELALLVSLERPEGPSREFAEELDRRVQARFGRTGAAAGGGAAGGGSGPGGRTLANGRWRRWGLTPMLGAAATAVVAVVVGIGVATSGGGPGTGSRQNLAARRHQAVATTASPATASSAPATLGALARGSGAKGARPGAAAAAPVAPPPRRPAPSASQVQNPAAGAVVGTPSLAPIPTVNAPLTGSAPTPLPNGRKIVQSSMLQLGTPASRIDTVAQEIFFVVHAVNAIVESSNVSSTGGPGASAQFHLRVPSPLLPQALSELSRLRYAHVISRTDNTKDVNSPYLSAERQITDAKAALVKLRASLAAATSQTEIASLKAQIAAQNARIANAQATLQSLNRQIDFSNVDVSVQADAGGGPAPGGGGGFGLHKAGHDALRVLEVTAGVALIALAALVPLGLLVALAWWVAVTVQRRRRERALDLA